MPSSRERFRKNNVTTYSGQAGVNVVYLRTRGFIGLNVFFSISRVRPKL